MRLRCLERGSAGGSGTPGTRLSHSRRPNPSRARVIREAVGKRSSFSNAPGVAFHLPHKRSGNKIRGRLAFSLPETRDQKPHATHSSSSDHRCRPSARARRWLVPSSLETTTPIPTQPGQPCPANRGSSTHRPTRINTRERARVRSNDPYNPSDPCDLREPGTYSHPR